MARMAALDRSRFRQVSRDTGSHPGGRNGCFVATQCTGDAHHRGDHQTVSDGGDNSSMLRSTRFLCRNLAWSYPFVACSYPFVGMPDIISSVFAYHVLRLTKKESEIDIRMR